MNRRRFLQTLTFASLGAAGGCGLSLEDGLWNPCLSDEIPDVLLQHEVVRAAWEGVDPTKCWDCHVHIAGIGDGNTGVWMSSDMQSLWHPQRDLQRRFYLNAACSEREAHVDEDFVARLLQQVDAFPRGAKFMLLAFDYYYDETGACREDRSSFYVPDGYAAKLARSRVDRFEWICSVHPYRVDAIDALEWAAKQGARAVKWLPSAMGIDPASPKCDRFYETLIRLRLPLLSHTGKEAAVDGADDELNNPLRLRRALDQGVRVIAAHCASIGTYLDLDRKPHAASVESFTLFTRLMEEPRYQGRLFGELSALTQGNRMGSPLNSLLARADWHARLINGSDYPLPGVIPLFSPDRLVAQGYLTDIQAQILRQIRRYNPLLFDFLLKRCLRRHGAGFAPISFESRRLFDTAV